MRHAMAISLAGLVLSGAYGQGHSSPPAFEVASVKQSAELDLQSRRPQPSGVILQDPGLVVYSGITLKRLLCTAYKLQLDQVVGPSWIDDERYDISAKVPGNASKAQVPEMLQGLLAARFRLGTHWVERQVRGFDLGVSKSGTKLTKSAKQDGDSTDGETKPAKTSGFTASGHLTWRYSTLDDFARGLSIFMAQPVRNATGLEGLFDITLDVSPDSLPGLHLLARGDSDLPTLSTAVRRLGLNLEPRELLVKQLVVDSAQKVPTEN